MSITHLKKINKKSTGARIKDIFSSDEEVNGKLDDLLQSMLELQNEDDLYDPLISSQDIATQLYLQGSPEDKDSDFRKDIEEYYEHQEEINAIDDPELVELLNRLDGDESLIDITNSCVESDDKLDAGTQFKLESRNSHSRPHLRRIK